MSDPYQPVNMIEHCWDESEHDNTLNERQEYRSQDSSSCYYYFEHESGSLNLLDACMIKQQNNERNQRRSSTVSSLRSSGTSIGSKFQISNTLLSISTESTCKQSLLEDEKDSIEDAVKSIVNDSDSWHKIREKIRSENLITSLGVFEVCLSSFREQADKMKTERLNKEMKEEAQLSKYSKLRRRWSIF